jgi:hypothetical protein
MNIVYSAIGSNFLREAILSSKSVLVYNPTAKITIYTDQANSEPTDNVELVSFQVMPRPTVSKVRAIM